MSNDERLLTAREAAGLLAVHVETLYRLVASGEVPARKLGKRWRFTASEVLAAGVPAVPSARLARAGADWRADLRGVDPYGVSA